MMIELNSKIHEVNFGENVKVIQPVNLYGCNIGEGSFIGPFVEIQKDVTIGSQTKIQSHSFVCELVTIGDNCFIGHGVMFINDLFEEGGPANGDKSKWKGTDIGNKGWTQKMYYGWLEQFIASLNNDQRKTLGFPDINTIPDEIKQAVLLRYKNLSKL